MYLLHKIPTIIATNKQKIQVKSENTVKYIGILNSAFKFVRVKLNNFREIDIGNSCVIYIE